MGELPSRDSRQKPDEPGPRCQRCSSLRPTSSPLVVLLSGTEGWRVAHAALNVGNYSGLRSWLHYAKIGAGWGPTAGSNVGDGTRGLESRHSIGFPREGGVGEG